MFIVAMGASLLLAIFIRKLAKIVKLRTVWNYRISSDWASEDSSPWGLKRLTEFVARRGRFSSQAQIAGRSEEHTSELQSLMRISYAVFCLQKKKRKKSTDSNQTTSTYTKNEVYYHKVD